MSVELAKAFVTIVPAFEKGIRKQITDELSGAGESAGSKAGGSFSDRFQKQLSSKLPKGVAGVLSKVALPTAIAGAAVAVLKGAYETGKAFDAMYDTIRVGTGQTGEAFEALKDDAKAILADVPNTAEQVGQAVADLSTRLGLTGDELQTVAKQYLEAGNILGTEVDISKTTAAFNAFNVEDTGAALDDLFTVSQKTGIGINELANAVASNAGAMQQLGFSFEETAAMAGMLDKVGISASGTFSKMSKGLVTLAKDGEEPAEAFQRITAEMQDLIDAGNTTEAINIASELFGTRGAAQFVSAMESGALSVEDMTKALEDNEGAIMSTADDTRDFAESWAILKNSIAVALEPFASGLFRGISDTINEVVQFAKELGSEIRDNLAEMFPNLADSGISFADVLSGVLVPVLKAFITIIATIGTAVAVVVGYVATAVQSIIGWFKALPENLANIPARMREIGRNIVDGIKNGISEKVSSIFDGLKSAIQNGIQWIKNLLGISSPSKLFEWIFEMTMEGGIVGIEKSEDKLARTMYGAVSRTVTAGELTTYSLDESTHGGNIYINGARINDTPGIENALLNFLMELQRLGTMQGANA